MTRFGRVLRLATGLGSALRVTGGWRELGRHLGREFRRAGLRRAYGALIGLVAIGGRNRDRWYRRWLASTEPADAPATPSKVVVVASFGELGDAAFDLKLSRLAECAAAGMVFLDAQSPRTESALATLAEAGVAALPTHGDFRPNHPSATPLPADCVGLVFIGRASCPNPRNLGALSQAIERGADLVYGDADEIDARSRRRPRFKPDFSLDLFLHDDFVSDCVAVSRALLDKVDPWIFDDPHGTLLGWVSRASRVEHLPIIASHALGKPSPPVGPPASLEPFLKQRYGDDARVETSAPSTPWRCRFGTDPDARVSVVIPTRDRLDLLAPCVDSLYDKNDAERMEVLIVDNGSEEPDTRAWLARMQERSNLRVIGAQGRFNWSWLNNLAIEVGTGKVFVFLNNDTLSITDGWLDRLAEYALRADAGAVGPLLLYPDGSIQHAGLVVGGGDLADQLYRGIRPEFDDHAFVSPLLPRNVSAVTGACMAVSRETLGQVGRFDERFPVSGDVEFCLRARGQGLVNIYAADVALHHYESRTRAGQVDRDDLRRLAALVGRQMPRDPFYNPNLAGIAGVGRGGPAFALLHADTGAEHLADAATSAGQR